MPKPRALADVAGTGQVPFIGARFVVMTDARGADIWRTVDRIWRQTDHPDVFTVRDSDGQTRWITWDKARTAFVRCGGQDSGEPVPTPSIEVIEPSA